MLQIHNLAAAHITLGVWSGEHARQINTKITDAIDFWLEKDQRQRTLWQPMMQVSERYAIAVREHCVPHDMRALIGLYKDTRAMDIYVWLAYRLPRVPLRHELFISLRRSQTDLRHGHPRPIQVPTGVQARS